MDEQTGQKKRVRDESSESDSPEVKRIREDLFDLLDDSDSVPAGYGDSDIRDLDSVMRSFEQELSAGSSPVPAPVGSVADLTSDSGESLPELGYLLEADDDELGLPTANAAATSSGKVEENRAAELIRVSSESSGLGGVGDSFEFEEGFTGYDSFEFGWGDINGDNGNGENDYVALGGIFDYSDVNYGPSDHADVAWGPKGLPTV